MATDPEEMLAPTVDERDVMRRGDLEDEEDGRGQGMEIFPSEEEDPEFHAALDASFDRVADMWRREAAGEDLTEEWAEIHRRAEERYEAMLRGEA